MHMGCGRVCLYHGYADWGREIFELPVDHIYDWSEKVEEGFWCLI